MIKRTQNEVIAFLSQLYERRPYSDTTFTASQQDGGWKLTLSQMYEFLPLGFENLCKISEFFGTRNITDERFSTPGCETCDWGSCYETTIFVREETEQ